MNGISLVSDRRYTELLGRFSHSADRPERASAPLPRRAESTQRTSDARALSREGRRGAAKVTPASGTPAVLIVNSYSEGEMYAEYLRSLGYEIHHVQTPEEAFPLLKEQPPAVIVTDMSFQGSAYDGPSFMVGVRELDGCAITRLIVVSGYVRQIDRDRARAAGADMFLVKPCMPDDLVRHVERAVRTQA